MSGRDVPTAEAFAAPPARAAGSYHGLAISAATGAVYVTGPGSGGSVVVIGNNTPADAYANPTDAIDANALVSGWWNGGSWLRARVNASGYWNVVSIGEETPTDAYVNPTDAVNTFSLLAGWNGATWDRIYAKILNSSPITNTTPGLQTASQIYATSSAGATEPLICWANQFLATLSGLPRRSENILFSPAKHVAEYPAAGPYVGTIQAASTRLLFLDVNLLSAAGGTFYFQLFDLAVPVTTVTVPLRSFKFTLAAGGNKDLRLDMGDLSPMGDYYLTGLFYALSTTPMVYTVQPAGPVMMVNASQSPI